jgi:hypothetical protein
VTKRIVVKDCELNNDQKVEMFFSASVDFHTFVISVVLLFLLELDFDVSMVWEVIKRSHWRIFSLDFHHPFFSLVTLQITHLPQVQLRPHFQNLLYPILRSSMLVVVQVFFSVRFDLNIVLALFQQLPMPEHFWLNSHTKMPNRPFSNKIHSCKSQLIPMKASRDREKGTRLDLKFWDV